MKTKILNISKILAFTSIAFLASKNSFGQCTTLTFQDDLNSSTGWTTVDPTNGNGSISIQAGEMHLHNPECGTTDGVHNNRQVRMYKPISQLDNFIWKAECRIRISNGNGVSHTFMGFTAGNLCPQTNPATTTWNCSTTSASQDNLITNWTNQDGIFASLIAFGENDSSNPNNQIPTTNTDQPFPPTSVQNSNDPIPANLGWRIYGHAVDGSNSAFFGTGTPRSSNFIGTIPPNRSRGIALPSIGNSYYIRLERLTATDARISVFSDASMTNHVPGSPQCFEISPTIQNLNTLQNFAHVSGSKFRRIRGEVDSYKIYNGCADVPNFNISAANAITCSNLTNTLIATPGATSSYTWSNGTIPTTVTTTNSLSINPSVQTTYTVTASFNGSCPIKATTTVTPTIPGTLAPSITSASLFCNGNPISVTGSTSGNVTATNYAWALDECDINNNIINGGFNIPLTWYSGNPSNFVFPNSSNIPCNKYYRVTLAVQNLPCIPWVVTSKVIYVACNPTPEITTSGSNICLGGNSTLCSDYLPSSTISTNWGIPKSLNKQCITIAPSAPGQYPYTLTVTNLNTGCSGQATAIVNVLDNNPDFLLGGDLISSTTYTCRATPVNQSALSNPNFGYSWIVEEIDKTTGNVVNLTTVVNPWNCWTPLYGIGTNQFSGYDGSNNFNCGTPSVGHFKSDSKYRITRGTWITNVCPWQQISHTIHLCYGCKTADGNPKVIIEDDNTTPDYSYLMNKQATGLIKNNSKLNIFPNPSNGQININISNAIDKSYTLEVFDVFGKLIYKDELVNSTGSEFNTEINLSNLNLSNGLYLINVNSENQKSSQRIVIEK